MDRLFIGAVQARLASKVSIVNNVKYRIVLSGIWRMLLQVYELLLLL